MKPGVERVNMLIGQRVERNRREKFSGPGHGGGHFLPLRLSASTSLQGLDYRRQVWSAGELLDCYDRQFVQKAYLAVLKRDCDVEGLGDRLRKLQSGAMSRAELLFRLRYGPEGKEQGVRVKGLIRVFLIEKICAIPLVGLLPRYLRALAYLPRMQREIDEIRGLIEMHKNDSDDRDRTIADFQNVELDKLHRLLNR